MATMNPFDLLGDDDNDDPSQLLAAAQLKIVDKPAKKAQPPASAAAQLPAKPAKLPTKPPPPAQAVREARNDSGRGEGGRGGGHSGGRGSGHGRGRGRGGGSGFNRDLNSNEIVPGSNNGYSSGLKPSEEGDSGRRSDKPNYGDRPRGGFRGGRHGGFSNGETAEGERPRRIYERRSGTGRGNEFKRDGAGRGNWGIPTDEITPETEEPAAEVEKNVGAEKQPAEEDAVDASKESPVNEAEEKEPEPEDKEMTLEEYEKVREEKRKALLALKAEERKVELDKDLKAMQPLSNKKSNDEVFIKLGSEKDKRKDAIDKEDRAKKSVNINEFLKPADGERYHGAGGRGRGRGHGSRGAYGGGYARDAAAAPAIEDPGHFPFLGGK